MELISSTTRLCSMPVLLFRMKILRPQRPGFWGSFGSLAQKPSQMGGPTRSFEVLGVLRGPSRSFEVLGAVGRDTLVPESPVLISAAWELGCTLGGGGKDTQHTQRAQQHQHTQHQTRQTPTHNATL